jgi:hypothetical protein
MQLDLTDLDQEQLDIPDSEPRVALDSVVGGHAMTELNASVITDDILLCSCCCCC